ncbi:MAG: prolyl oligopeptidase family serine peptidase [Telluria sp.]|nr:prolyl oligopeptidase family serine peptidase [Telluria sp.]
MVANVRAVALIVLGALTLSVAQAAPPVAPVRDVVETLHGVAVHDPYRYFENVKAPEVQAWLRGQGAYARESLDRIEGRAQMVRRIGEIASAAGDSIRDVVRMPGDRVFYLKRERNGKQYKLVMRARAQGREKLLVDPEADAARTGVAHAVNYFMPSWDGRYVAYGLSSGGSEDASLHVLDVRSGRPVGAPIARVRESGVSWLPDSKSLTYNQLKVLSPEDAETETYLDSRVMWLAVGQPESAARPVFGPTVTPDLGLARLDVGRILFTPGSPWMVARTTDTTLPEGSLFVARVSDLALPRVPWKRISAFDDHIVEIELKGDELYYRTRKGEPRYKVMKLDLRQPDLARAAEVALPPADGVLEGFVLARHALFTAVRQGTAIGLRRHAAGDRGGRAIALPVPGAARAHDDPAHAHGDLLYTLSGWTQLPRTWRLRGERSVDAGLQARVAMPPLPEIEVADVKVRSHDGVLVPMTLLYRKGLKRDGNNPTLLNGYAAYGHSHTAGFYAPAMAWLEQGGVVALANVLGSGVYGEPWRMAGFKATKANTWKDGVACAQYLIEQGYASPRTLGVMGTSAGGIFAGRTVTTAPQLFAAAIFNVGVMDAVRAEDSANGITNISEFGSYRNPQEFPALLAMSTYHQVQDGTPYPAVLVVHGLNDPRVDVWHSAKVVARLQAASTSGKPVLLRLDAQAGHGVGSTAAQRDALAADMYSFLLWQMGKRRAD